MTDIPPAVILDTVQPGAVLVGGIAASIAKACTALPACRYTCSFIGTAGTHGASNYSLIDSLHMAMVVHSIYFYLIKNFGNATAMLKPTWSIVAHVYFTIASDFCIRMVFAKRLWGLSRNYVLTAAIVATSLSCAISGVIFLTKAWRVGEFVEFHIISVSVHFIALFAYLYISLGSGVVADILVAFSLSVTLWKTRTGFKKKTDDLCMIDLTVYFNALLAALNSRQILREKVSGLSAAPTSLTAAASGGSTGRGVFNKDLNFYELESGIGGSVTTSAPQVQVVNITRSPITEEFVVTETGKGAEN
ncbi:hypothetical protein NP233_g6334 [Leucocoprinus birnbaumii]|uniref:Uncharacterized protein n=1 Tax=Leucocoprinus birnbaumii TaxID=56174 RepID=A0AAD5VUQ4_9AGAR|nr:hypothetical protein NP233_g6334 [Leucocoprinus birnbaumii]